MTRTREERLVKWLQDDTMEQEAETMMSAMAGRIQHYPDLRQWPWPSG
jgi:ferritin-like metal-binding protein YciE